MIENIKDDIKIAVIVLCRVKNALRIKPLNKNSSVKGATMVKARKAPKPDEARSEKKPLVDSDIEKTRVNKLHSSDKTILRPTAIKTSGSRMKVLNGRS